MTLTSGNGTIPPNTTTNDTLTSNTTIPLNNTDVNGTDNTPPLNVMSTDCTSSNPNLRSPDCLLANVTTYFPDQAITWNNWDRMVVARFTVIGNLHVRGTLHEHASGVPGPRNFTIGYQSQDGSTDGHDLGGLCHW